MAYMSQERKKEIAAELKRVIPKGWKWTLAVRHHSTIVLNIAAAPIDLIADAKAMSAKNSRRCQTDRDDMREMTYTGVNPYWYHEHFSPEVVAILKPILEALNRGNYNNSDIQTDYFDVGWYVDVNIGRWNKPFVVLP